MRLASRFVVVVGVVFGLDTVFDTALNTASAQTDRPTAECNSRCVGLKTDFRFAVKTSNEIYCYFAEKIAETRRNYDHFGKELENSITSSTTPADYFLLLRRWAGSFNDGHVNVLPSEDGPDVSLPSSDIRFEVLAAGTANEKVIISAAPLIDPGILGAEVLTFEGKSIRAALDVSEPLGNGSTKRMRRQSAARRLIETTIPVVDVTRGALIRIRLKSGAERDIELPLRLGVISPAPAPVPPGKMAVQSSILPGNIGYLRIDQFSGIDSVGDLNRAMDAIEGTAGLLIDVRKNGGGDQSGDSVIARLIKSPVTRYEISPRLSRMVLDARPQYGILRKIPGTDFAEWGALKVNPTVLGKGWAGKPVVVLTGNSCFSACDTFTSALQANNLAEIVGEGTGGGTGTPHIFTLPVSRHDFRYSVVRGRTFKGTAIEGIGTLPTLSIPVTLAERQANEDRQLKKALERLASQMRGRGGRGAIGTVTREDATMADLGMRQVDARKDPGSGRSSGLTESLEEALLLRTQR